MLRGIAYLVFMERMQTTTTHRGDSLRKEGLMTSSESQCRQFAAEFNTPNVQRAIALCEAGTLTWDQVYSVFKQSLAKGLTEVAA
jgi:hypothetical protein